jgi:hypothetical protein
MPLTGGKSKRERQPLSVNSELLEVAEARLTLEPVARGFRLSSYLSPRRRSQSPKVGSAGEAQVNGDTWKGPRR